MPCKCGNQLKSLSEQTARQCALCTIYETGLQHCWLNDPAEREEIRAHGIKIGGVLPDYSGDVDDISIIFCGNS